MKFVIAFIVVLVNPNDTLQPALIEFDKHFSAQEECQAFLDVYSKEKLFSEYREMWIEEEDSLPMLILAPDCFEKDIEKDFIPMLRDFYNIEDFVGGRGNAI